VDVEADGPVPGRYSLVSLGACVAAVLVAAGRVEIIDPDQHTFYRELKPISETWNEEALAVSGLTREHVAQHGAEPSVASTEFVAWVDEMAARFHAKPVFAAYPLGFEWQFAYHYMLVYAGRSPFGHSAHFDMKTAYAVLARIGVREATKRDMPPELLGSRRHTHNALDDAKGAISSRAFSVCFTPLRRSTPTWTDRNGRNGQRRLGQRSGMSLDGCGPRPPESGRLPGP
jgi:hypothetical protein